MVSFMVRPAFLMELVLSRTLKLLSRTFKLPLMESFAAASRLSALARTVFCTRVRESVLLLRASVVRFTSSPESSRADWRSGRKYEENAEIWRKTIREGK